MTLCLALDGWMDGLRSAVVIRRRNDGAYLVGLAREAM